LQTLRWQRSGHLRQPLDARGLPAQCERGGVALAFLASLYGYLVLPAVQLLWINLLTDGSPALALGAAPKAVT